MKLNEKMYKEEERIYNGNIQDAFKTKDLSLKFTLIKNMPECHTF